jgi:hypothetical protein
VQTGFYRISELRAAADREQSAAKKLHQAGILPAGNHQVVHQKSFG